MTDDDFMRLQDDGCPHTGEHVYDWTKGIVFWIGGRAMYVVMAPSILTVIESKRRSRDA